MEAVRGWIVGSYSKLSQKVSAMHICKCICLGNHANCTCVICCVLPYKRNIWRTLYLANKGKNRIGEILNWRSTL